MNQSDERDAPAPAVASAWNAVKYVYALVCRAEMFLAMFLLSAATFLIFFSAVMRTLKMPLNWSLEISLFMFAWCVFFCADIALRGDRFVNLDIVVKYFSARKQLCFQILSYLIILVFLILVIRYGFILAERSKARTFQGIPNFSYYWITISFPIASILMSTTAVIKLWDLFGRLIVGKGADQPSPDSASNAAT